jgi:hypothetical protein
MIVQMPKPIPLEMPPGDADAIADLARGVGSAGRCLASLDVRISGPAVDAPGWLGADASAAAAQVLDVSTLIRRAHEAVSPAAERLASHAEFLLEARSQVRTLRHEQDAQFREAWRRWYALPDLQAQLMIGGPGVRAIVADVETGEAIRRRRHHALLEDLEDETAATARVLANSCAAVGGHGRSGDAERVVAYLAAQLPGWGDRELGRLARVVATGLTDGTPESKSQAASDAAVYASCPAFATALFAALRVEGVSYVLRDMGRGDTYTSDSPVAPVLAAAFGAADLGDSIGGPAQRVLDAEYVRPEDGFEKVRDVATGLAMVLAAGGTMPAGGVSTRTVASWSRQFLLWENQQGDRIGTRSAAWAPEAGDPTSLAISILAERGDPGVSAALLDDSVVWKAALRRRYDDGGEALGELIAQAGQEGGERGDRVLLMGLATAGAGLAGDDPMAWTVNRQTLAGIAPGFAAALSAHIDVAVGALEVGVDGHLHRSQPDILAGLGYLTLDRGAAAAIEQALSAWTGPRPDALRSTGLAAPLKAAAVLGAFVAVEEFAQRTDHAMDALEDQALAQAKKALWDHSVAVLPERLPKQWGIVGGVVTDYGAILLDTDGTWDDRPDRGLIFHRADAAALARKVLGPREVGDVRAVVLDATAAFDRTAAALPVRPAPRSPTADLAGPLMDLGIDFVGERLERGHGTTFPRFRLPR